jgi:transcriptional regulator with GAF, ATPase, and Fis domain
MVGSLLISGSAGVPALVVAGAVLAGVGVLPVVASGYWATQDQKLEDEYEARERIVLRAVAGFTREAADVTILPRARRAEELDRVVEESLGLLCDVVFNRVDGIRAVVYAISDDSSELTVLHQAGRPDRAGAFAASDPTGAAVFERLTAPENHTFFSGDDPSATLARTDERGYATFISAPIRSASNAYGMLTLDAPSPGDLDSRDGDLIEVLASALCLYFAEAARGARAR